VRDVESLLKARLDVAVYYKKIGVVQVVDNDFPVEDQGTGTLPPTASAIDPAPVAPDTAAEAGPASGVTFHPPRADSDDLLPAGVAEFDRDSTAVADLPDPLPAILVAEDFAVRVVCGSVSVMASDLTLRAEVQLAAGDIEARGLREGANHANSDLLLVAQAAVAAVAELICEPVLLHLKDVRLQDLEGHRIVLAAVDLVEGRQSTTLFGTCSTSHNRHQAVVYAVLDALNRRLSLHELKTLSGAG